MSPLRTAAPLKDAVPPGASLAYNLVAVHAAHAPHAAPATCALLRPASRAISNEAAAAHSTAVDEAPATHSTAVRPEPVEGRVTHPCAAPCASTGSARTAEGGDAAFRDHAPPGAATADININTDTIGTNFNTDTLDTNTDVNTATPATGPAALRQAIAHCGGQSALASAIGLSQSHVWNWLNRRSIPAEHCPAIERATERAVRCEALRPDVDWAYLRAVCEELAAVGEGEA